MDIKSYEDRVLLLIFSLIAIWGLWLVLYILLKVIPPIPHIKPTPEDMGVAFLALDLIILWLAVGFTIISVVVVFWREIFSFFEVIFTPYMSVFWNICASLVFLIAIVTEMVRLPYGPSSHASLAKVLVILCICSPVLLAIRNKIKYTAGVIIGILGIYSILVFVTSHDVNMIDKKDLLFYLINFLIITISGFLEIDYWREKRLLLTNNK